MVKRVVRLTEKVAGSILLSVAASVPVGNTLVCAAMIFFGPALVIKILCR